MKVISKVVSDLVGYEVNPFTGDIQPVFQEWVHNEKVIQLHKAPKQVYKKKAIISGDVIEIVSYEEPIVRGIDRNNKMAVGKKKTGDVKRKDNIDKSKKELRRIVNANVTGNDLFITLTYSDNMQDIDKGKKDYKKFVMRWNYRRKKEGKGSLKYVYVVEFQERGAIHFHCVFFGVGYIQKSELFKLWGHGFVDVKKIDHVDNVGAYLVKYMSKALEDSRVSNKDLYGRSKGNLENPVEVITPNEVALIEGLYKNNIVYNSSYTSEHFGRISYVQYNTKRKPIATGKNKNVSRETFGKHL